MMTDKRKILGLSGAGLLFLGVFTPIISFPIMGSLNYIQNGKPEGIIVILLAIISFVLVLINQYKALYVTAAGALGLLALTLINFEHRVSEAGNRIQIDLSADNPFKDFGNLGYQVGGTSMGMGDPRPWGAALSSGSLRQTEFDCPADNSPGAAPAGQV